MALPDVAHMTLAEASSLIKRKEVSPLELTEACIARSQALDPKLNAYMAKTFETALVDAKAATEEIARGKRRSPLHGIPFGLKDLYETAGVVTTAGSKLRENYVPREDAFVVTRLKHAGAVLMGKLNMHEWALGATNINKHFPSPRNPWDPERISGGSSGGSGVAVATGMCLGALGSDTGGSIRIPAALCGVTGIKPTYGRASLRGVVPLAWTLDHPGPLARTALDCALILQEIACCDPLDPTCADEPVPDYRAALSPRLTGVRVGVPTNFFFDQPPIDEEVARLVRDGIDVLKQLGAEVQPVEVPDIEKGARANGTILLGDAAAYHEDNMREHAAVIGETVLARLENGARISALNYARARRTQDEFKAALRGMFKEIDLLVAPTTAGVAERFPNGDSPVASVALTRNTGPFNISGLPAISVPCGFNSEGMPAGMMIVGRWWEEGLVLRAGYAYQHETDWHTRRPPV
jgi:aspartyl-tRNA(Asn)/glutamyl-tRNA(Gln) amidotransferase subunit A